VTADNIAMHEPRHRNKALARMLMTYHLVDRAGMGILRMGIRSLMYGRAFPQFSEDNESVEVSMQGEYLRSTVTVLAVDNEEEYGIAELLVLNSVYESGVVPVKMLIEQLSKLVDEPWKAIQNAVNMITGVELCGISEGVFVRVRREWMKFFCCSRFFRVTSNSKKHVSLYIYLQKHDSVSTSDVHPILGGAHQSYTSKFLAEAKYTRRSGHGRSSRWSLV
jgi:ATP-dependent DNA helicase RecG